jgi:hypothetical protein
MTRVILRKRMRTTVPTHLDKRSFGADAIQCLRQGLIVLADIFVLKQRGVFTPGLCTVRYELIP